MSRTLATCVGLFALACRPAGVSTDLATAWRGTPSISETSRIELDDPDLTLTGDPDVQFGLHLAGVGDVDGDGYDDVVVTACEHDESTGQAYLYRGASSGLDTSPALTLSGGAAGDEFGCAVAGAGDVDNDGYDDVIIGAPGAGDGAAYLYHGSASGLSSTATTTLAGSGGGTSFGYAVAGAGDVDGDGYDDVIVGAPALAAGVGTASLYAGGASGVATTASTTLSDPPAERFGWSVAGAGDVNHDGYDDVIIGEPDASAYAGRAAVFTGSPTGLATGAAATWEGPGGGDLFGFSVAGAGDVDGDGYDDLIVGSPYLGESGSAFVYAGGAAGPSATAQAELEGHGSVAEQGYAVAGLGDLDGDGYDDVIAGAPGYYNFTGYARVYPGSSAGVDVAGRTELGGSSDYTYFGAAVASAGDFNGDGAPDLLVSAYGLAEVYVWLGSGATGGDSGDTAEDTGGDSGPTVSDTAADSDSPATDDSDPDVPTDDSDASPDSDAEPADTASTTKDGGCADGCATGGSTGSAIGLALAAMAVRRRRKSPLPGSP